MDWLRAQAPELLTSRAAADHLLATAIRLRCNRGSRCQAGTSPKRHLHDKLPTSTLPACRVPSHCRELSCAGLYPHVVSQTDLRILGPRSWPRGSRYCTHRRWSGGRGRGCRDGGQSAEVCLLAWAILERCLSAGPQQFQDALTLQHSSFTDWAPPAQDLAGAPPSPACIGTPACVLRCQESV